jgi:hypothetical protein
LLDGERCSLSTLEGTLEVGLTAHSAANVAQLLSLREGERIALEGEFAGLTWRNVTLHRLGVV